MDRLLIATHSFNNEFNSQWARLILRLILYLDKGDKVHFWFWNLIWAWLFVLHLKIFWLVRIIADNIEFDREKGKDDIQFVHSETGRGTLQSRYRKLWEKMFGVLMTSIRIFKMTFGSTISMKHTWSKVVSWDYQEWINHW